MHNDGILLLVNGLGMHKTTMSEKSLSTVWFNKYNAQK